MWNNTMPVILQATRRKQNVYTRCLWCRRVKGANTAKTLKPIWVAQSGNWFWIHIEVEYYVIVGFGFCIFRFAFANTFIPTLRSLPDSCNMEFQLFVYACFYACMQRKILLIDRVYVHDLFYHEEAYYLQT